MKKLILVLSLVWVSNANARLQPAEFTLGEDPQDIVGTSHCTIRTRLQLDEGKVIGKVAYFEEYLEGFCKIAVRPNPRLFKLTRTGSNCGSEVYQGEGVDSFGVAHQIVIVDHRTRLCEDVVPAQIVVQDISEGKETLLYSLLEKAKEVSCLAYWEGYIVDPASKSCVLTSASACRNPFKYSTQESCEAGIKRGEARVPNL